jgi:hypothetical protein
MEHSIFMDKEVIPGDHDLEKVLGESYFLWDAIRKRVLKEYPAGIEEWNFPGKNYGWSFRIKDKKRAILYLLPRDPHFMVAFVFGQKAFEAIKSSRVSDFIKQELSSARVYGEGRGIRIPVPDQESLEDIFLLLKIKLAN